MQIYSQKQLTPSPRPRHLKSFRAAVTLLSGGGRVTAPLEVRGNRKGAAEAACQSAGGSGGDASRPAADSSDCRASVSAGRKQQLSAAGGHGDTGRVCALAKVGVLHGCCRMPHACTVSSPVAPLCLGALGAAPPLAVSNTWCPARPRNCTGREIVPPSHSSPVTELHGFPRQLEPCLPARLPGPGSSAGRSRRPSSSSARTQCLHPRSPRKTTGEDGAEGGGGAAVHRFQAAGAAPSAGTHQASACALPAAAGA